MALEEDGTGGDDGRRAILAGAGCAGTAACAGCAGRAGPAGRAGSATCPGWGDAFLLPFSFDAVGRLITGFLMPLGDGAVLGMGEGWRVAWGRGSTVLGVGAAAGEGGGDGLLPGKSVGIGQYELI